MKKLLSILTMVTLIAAVSFAQTTKNTATAKEGGAEMTFEKTTVDYGNINQGDDPYRVFKFTNTGTEPLIIKKAKGSCGCTVPTYPKEPIAPGASAEIKVRYDTKRIGKINKSITLQTNAGVKLLKIAGNVKKKAAPASVPANQKKSILDQ
jgi:hypothetical protein